MHSVDVFALSLFCFCLFVALLYCVCVCMCSDRATSSTAWRGVRFINYLIIIIIIAKNKKNKRRKNCRLIRPGVLIQFFCFVLFCTEEDVK